jgi:peptide/nickel transport system permease protein
VSASPGARSLTLGGWIARRLLLAVPTLLGLTVVAFLLAHLAPGGPFSHLLGGGERGLTPQQVDEIGERLGFHRPLTTQYLEWLWNFVRLDFGESWSGDHRPVRALIGEAFGVSFVLQLVAALLMYAIGIPLGIFCAARAGSRLERAVAIGLFALQSLPVLLVGTVAIALFCTGPLGHLPMTGLASPDLPPDAGLFTVAADAIRHALLPVLCLTLAGLAGVARYARAGVVEALRQPFVQAARARGLPERLVLLRHAARTGLLPTVTLLASLLPWLVGGSVVVENLFSIPGLGRLSREAILARDYPTVMALTVLVGLATMVGFLLTDLLHARLRRGEPT